MYGIYDDDSTFEVCKQLVNAASSLSVSLRWNPTKGNGLENFVNHGHVIHD